MVNTVLRIISLVVFLSALWLGLSGFFEPLLLTLGALSVALVVWVSHRMQVADHEGHPSHMGLRAIPYTGWLLWQVVLANLDVAKTILGNPKKVNPQVFTVKGSQRSELGNVIYANSITLTPGTVTCDVEDGVFLIHALTKTGAEGVLDGVMDAKVTHFEGLSLDSESKSGERV